MSSQGGLWGLSHDGWLGDISDSAQIALVVLEKLRTPWGAFLPKQVGSQVLLLALAWCQHVLLSHVNVLRVCLRPAPQSKTAWDCILREDFGDQDSLGSPLVSQTAAHLSS